MGTDTKFSIENTTYVSG